MNKTLGSKFFQAMLVIPVAVVLGFALGLLQAYVVSQVWGWFAVNHFGLPHLPVLVALGLLIGANVAGLTRQPKDPEGDTVIERMAAYIAGALIRIFMAWLMAYVVYCLV